MPPVWKLNQLLLRVHIRDDTMEIRPEFEATFGITTACITLRKRK